MKNFTWILGTFLYKNYIQFLLQLLKKYSRFTLSRCELRIWPSMSTHQGKDTSGLEVDL